jgi:hypothetical protein
VALGLPIDYAGFHPTTVVKFRARMLLHGKERLVLERTLELATELGLMEGSVEQIVDSTPMFGAAATQDTVTPVRSCVAKLLAAVRGADEEAASTLEAGLAFDYRKPRQKPDCDWRDKGEREALLTRVAEDAERALRAVEAVPELIEDESVEQAQALLRELIGQGFDIDDHGNSQASPRHPPGPHRLGPRSRDAPWTQVKAPVLRRLQVARRRDRRRGAAGHRRRG